MNTRDIMRNIIRAVKNTYSTLGDVDLTTTLQVIPDYLLAELKLIDPTIDKYQLDKALDEMTRKEWVLLRNTDIVLFDEVVLQY